MGGLWCRDIPFAVIKPAPAPKPVTLIYPFYENHLFLMEQIANWWNWDALARSLVSAIVVDDGSPHPLTLAKVPLPFPVRVFRIEQDVRWNWLAARNIGAHHADDGWLLITDIDHVIPNETINAVIRGQHDERTVYAFSRDEHTGVPIAPHSASFLMTRKMFWHIGGYDERFSGYYGTDGIYRRRVREHARMALLTDRLVRYEFVSDSSTKRYERKQPQDAEVKRIAAKIPKGARPKVLSFPYHEVTA